MGFFSILVEMNKPFPAFLLQSTLVSVIYLFFVHLSSLEFAVDSSAIARLVLLVVSLAIRIWNN